MINFKAIKKERGGMVCRNSLNREYDVNLTPADCKYFEGKKMGATCRYPKHIVKGLTFSGKMKTLFK